jgi:hypothetical protein
VKTKLVSARASLIAIALLWLACGASALAPQANPPPSLSDAQLLDQVQRRAFRFFWERADPHTGLVNDRARNDGADDDYTVASIASTGYALAALPVAVKHGWVSRSEADRRARLILRFLAKKMAHVHGWFYHFVDMRTGRRVWNCEVSTIDTALLTAGALTSGQYFRGDVQQLANALYDRLDWTWMRTNGGAQPGKLVVSHGWTPEKGFLQSDWGSYCEATLLYLLGMGAKRGALPPASWTAWKRPVFRYAGRKCLAGGPIFLHQMAFAYYDLKGLRDRQGYDYWDSSVNATLINRRFCMDQASRRKTYGPDIWGLNAGDGPRGYMAYGVPEPEDGTVSPTGALASIVFTPELSLAAARAMYNRFGAKLWGRYGFADAFNVDAAWFDPDVIGIDLGMALLAIENHRSGLIWKLMRSHPSTARAFAAAGLRKTERPGTRSVPLQRPSRAGQQNMGRDGLDRVYPDAVFGSLTVAAQRREGVAGNRLVDSRIADLVRDKDQP